MQDLFSISARRQSNPVIAQRIIDDPRNWFEARMARAASHDGYAEVGYLTPALASFLLAQNMGNRSISKSNLLMLRNDAANGRFKWNGESIVISSSGALLDGQHRCEMVVHTQKEVKVVFVFGPDDDARTTIDSGKKRTVADLMHMNGKKNTKVLASAALLALQYSEFNRLDRAHLLTQAQIVAAENRFSDLSQSVEFVCGLAKKDGATALHSRVALVFCHWLFTRASSRSLADKFIVDVLTGEGLYGGDPAYYCRTRLPTIPTRERVQKRVCFIIRCWNSWRLGERLTKMNVSSPEELPHVEA